MCLVRSEHLLHRFHDIDVPLDITNFIYENPGMLDLNTKGFWISDRMPSPIKIFSHR